MKRIHFLIALIMLTVLVVISGCSGSETVSMNSTSMPTVVPTAIPTPTLTPTPIPTSTPTPTPTPTISPEQQVLEQLAAVPFDYTLEQASKDGCFVIVNAKALDYSIADKFVADTTAGKSASLRIVKGWTDDPDLDLGIALIQIDFDGQMYHYAQDYTRYRLYFEGEVETIARSYAYLNIVKEPDSSRLYVFLSQDRDCTYEEFVQSQIPSEEEGKNYDYYANAELYVDWR